MGRILFGDHWLAAGEKKNWKRETFMAQNQLKQLRSPGHPAVRPRTASRKCSGDGMHDVAGGGFQ